jgi:hypothetical protein
MVWPGLQLGAAQLIDDGSAGVPSGVSSLNRNPAIRFSLPLSAGTEQQDEHTTRAARKNRLHRGIWLGGRARVLRLRNRTALLLSDPPADAAPARTAEFVSLRKR